MRGGAATTLPWLRAPILLLRQPVVFLAIVGASAILAMAAASGPLFLSTIGTASLHSQAEQTCPENTQPGISVAVAGSAASATAARGTTAMRSAGLPAPRSAVVGESRVQNTLIHVFASAGALRHVTRLTPSAGAGVWVPDNFAGKIGARPGSQITTQTGQSVRVAGIYKALAPDPYSLSNLPPYWCSWSDLVVATVASDQAIAATPPSRREGPLFIADQATVARLVAGPVRVSLHSPMSTTASALGSFDRSVNKAGAAAVMTSPAAVVDTQLPQRTRIAHAAQQGLTGSIVPIEIAGVLIAALLVGGAGAFWASARRREIRLLVARGVGPPALAGKAVLETAIPAAVGAAAGFVGTMYLVRGVGPSPVFESGAAQRALVMVAGTLLLGLALIGLIGGLAGRERTVGRRASWPARVPWELLLIGAAVAIALTRLDDSAVSIDHTVVRISALVILYPLLGATGALLLIGRVIAALLPALGRSARRGPAAVFLALRRMSRSRAIAVGLIIGTALPCCLLMYGSTVRDTVSREVTEKYQTNLGAPHVLQIYGVHGKLLDLHSHGSQVVVYDQDVVLGGTQGYVIGVDTKTFRDFAFTTDEQRSAVGKLAPSAHGSVPAIIANSQGPPSTNLRISRTDLEIDPVATTRVFPGLRNSALTLIVVDQRALSTIDNGTERTNQVWTDNADYAAARHQVEAAKYSVLFQLTSKIVVGTTGLLPVTWVFGYLQALAILIGVVAIAGLVFGLAARTRNRRVSYVLSRRMGMSRWTHVNSLLLELGTVLGLGWVAGTTLGVGSFGLIYRRLDVYPQLPPPARFAIAYAPLATSAVIVTIVVGLAATATQALAERTRPAEILRLE